MRNDADTLSSWKAGSVQSDEPIQRFADGAGPVFIIGLPATGWTPGESTDDDQGAPREAGPAG